MTSNPVGWFEIPAHDLGRARAFYAHLLGVELEVHDFGALKMAWFPGDSQAPGAVGALVEATGYVPSHAGSMVYFEVGDIEATLVRVGERGGKVLNPKMSIGEYGFVAHFEDCEGNRVALHSSS